jgi:hypothetical protein
MHVILQGVPPTHPGHDLLGLLPRKLITNALGVREHEAHEIVRVSVHGTMQGLDHNANNVGMVHQILALNDEHVHDIAREL